MKKNLNLGILVGRISVGALMLPHGIAKLVYGTAGIKSMLASAGLPEFLFFGVYLGEVIAPLMILIGFRTRIAAGIYAINCAAAMLLAHSNNFFTLNEYGGWSAELLGLYLFGSILLYFTGAGSYAVSTKNNWD